jgi:hypothetical protein
MQNEPDVEDDSDAVDESSLAGLSEYSATGGGGNPPHFPQMVATHEVVDEPEVPDASSFRELYRWSLGRSTQDAHMEEGEEFFSEEGPLHVEAARKKKTP